ncbi:MAG: hypothetical protein JWR08_2524 [Enterovirga sp.]|nr:hypothetical protein [Enterovirga sp.]
MSGISDSIEGLGDVPSRSVPRRLLAMATDRSEAGRTRRLAAFAFVARVFNAGLGFATQILLARWMGEREYGVYAYVWVWLLVAGGVGSLGLPVAALKLVPDYSVRGDASGLRGFLDASRTLGLLPSLLASSAAAGAVWAFGRGVPSDYAPVALVALVILPMYVLTDIQTGIARAYDDMDLGLAADYLLRPLLLLVFSVSVFVAGAGGTAVNIMTATLAAMAVTALVQGTLLQARLSRRVPAGPRRLDLRRWAAVSWPLLTVTAFTLLLGATDILVLKLFAGPEDIALYFAATKIIAIASFVSYGVSNTSAHRFSEQMARGDRAGMAALAAETVRWTFWPTLAVAGALAVLAGPLLSLFGPSFADGYPVVAILGLGLVAGAAVGPADRALAMADHGRVVAWIYGLSFAANLALALALIPLLGLPGAALATALATAARAALLFVTARQRLGLDMIVFGGSHAAPGKAAALHAPGGLLTGEFLTGGQAGGYLAEWQQLSERALEPNLFYRPETALAGLRNLPGGAGGRVVAIFRQEGPGRRLVGILPVSRPGKRHLNPFPIMRAAEFYSTLSTPLLDPDDPSSTLREMLQVLAQHGYCGISLPFLHPAGPVAAALDEVCSRDGLIVETLGAHRRAMLRSDLGPEEYLRATLESRRRKEFDRQRRRLADEGTLVFSVLTTPFEVAAALESFFVLEDAGWKGRAGTALARAPGAAAFFRIAAADLAAAGRFRVGTLTLDGRVIAAGLVGIAGRRAFYLKTAYDESFARFSPGLLLTLDLTRHLLADPTVDDADSIAIADHPMIDRVWSERFPVTSVLVSTRPGGGSLFRAAGMVERLRERAIERLKRLRADFERSRKARNNQEPKKGTAEAPV